MNVKLENQGGITLVALVVTIIILMILAGITLTLVLGQNGMINQALKAKKLSANDQKATYEGLNSLYNEMTAATTGTIGPTTVVAAIGKNLSDTDNIPIKDDNGNIVTIPAGFHIADGSPTKQEQGIIIEDKEQNQFVWIPVANISDYKRTPFFGENINYTFTEEMPEDQQVSISTYHGYYIGRYEAGDSVSTAGKILRTSGASITNKLTIKKGQAPYNWITRDQSKILSEGMKTAEGYKATTKLCSSYAWDTAINFIQKTIADYGTNSPQGNYYNISLNYTDIAGVNQTKGAGTYTVIPTGETTPVCNIYDMGGNTWEWTTETNYDTNDPGVYRGGGCTSAYTSGCPAGSRNCNAMNYSNYFLGFRVAIYM